MPRSTAYSANSNLIITVIGCLLITWLATPASAWQQQPTAPQANQIKVMAVVNGQQISRDQLVRETVN
ncbi:MAG: hypothetical protein GY819_08150, partial [Planctomycetaceae bacterium]|nr:hypothetical protein [Planctomycetaceae bacterium]